MPLDLPPVVAPAVALVVVGLLALVLRWAYPREDSGRDFGLLTEIVTVDRAAAGREVRTLLSKAGIRSTMTRDRTGRIRVLVFPSDAPRARELVERL